LALKWKDANITGGEITLRRGVVQQVVGEMKTETSQKPLPMVGALAETLQDWKTHSIYTNPEDWVFASPVMRGTQPYWPGSLLVKRIRPAALRVGITYRLAYIPQDICNVAERERRRYKNHSGTHAPCK
jgi:integrase